MTSICGCRNDATTSRSFDGGLDVAGTSGRVEESQYLGRVSKILKETLIDQ